MDSLQDWNVSWTSAISMNQAASSVGARWLTSGSFRKKAGGKQSLPISPTIHGSLRNLPPWRSYRKEKRGRGVGTGACMYYEMLLMRYGQRSPALSNRDNWGWARESRPPLLPIPSSTRNT